MPTLDSATRITPFLWFDANAEDAVNHYLSIFKNSRILTASRNGDKVFTIAFELDGMPFVAMNGGPLYAKFTEAVSFVVHCASQDEVDEYWSALCEGGTPGRCCWLKDKFGLSWQIVPTQLPALIRHPKALQAMMKMSKPDIAELERAAQS